MNKNNEQHIIENILKQSTRYKAPSDMGDRVWSKLQEQDSQATVFRPLIAKWVRVAIGLFVFVVLLFGLFTPTTGEGGLIWLDWLTPITDSFIQNLNNLSLIVFSSLTVLTLIFFLNAMMINSRYRNFRY